MINKNINLFLAMSGIYVVSTIQSIFNEQIVTLGYKNNQKFAFPSFLAFLQTVIYILNYKEVAKYKEKKCICLLSFLGLLIYLNEVILFNARQIIGFRLIQIISLLRLVPICVLKRIVFNEIVPTETIFSCLITTIGVIIFSINDTAILNDNANLLNKGLLISILLFLSGIINNLSDYIFKYHRVTTAVSLFYTSLFTFIPATIQTSIDIKSLFIFIARNPIVLLQLSIKTFLHFINKNLLYFCLREYGSVKTNYITLCRKVLTILFSSIYFQHPLFINHYIGLLFILIGLIAVSGKNKQK